MRVIYYQRRAFNLSLGKNAGVSSQFIYIPDHDIGFYIGQEFPSGRKESGLIPEQGLEIARAIARGEIPDNGPKYSEIKELDYDNAQILELVEDARQSAELKAKVDLCIEEIIAQAKR